MIVRYCGARRRVSGFDPEETVANDWYLATQFSPNRNLCWVQNIPFFHRLPNRRVNLQRMRDI
jgi:hypothetical protein